jgi:hypothetical protein
MRGSPALSPAIVGTGRRPVLVRALSDESEGEETEDDDDDDMEEPVDVVEV